MTSHESQTPHVKDGAPAPKGLLPRQTQAWVIGGIAVVMMAIVALTGNPAPERGATKTAGVVPVVTDPSQPRIQEYRARLDEQTRRLADEQVRLAQAKQQLAASAAGGPASPQDAAERDRATVDGPERDREMLKREQAEREYRSLFASNVAVSYRAAAANGDASRSIAAARPPTPKGQAGTAEPGVANASDNGGTADGSPRYRLFEGTVIETVLTNRLASSFAGPVNCLVTVPVYTTDREHLLIPAGSRVLGEVRRVESVGQERLAVVFHRVLRPDSSSVSLDQAQGLNQIGETGLRDDVNHHYWQTFGMAGAIGAIGGLAQANTRYSAIGTSAGDTFRQGASANLAQSSMNVLDRYLNVLPTFTIREGHRIQVYVARDLFVPPYPAPAETVVKE